MAWKGWALFAVVWSALACGPAAAADSLSPDASTAVRWILRSADHAGQPFAVVDKKGARLHVFDARGRLQGSSQALLGQALGDDIAPEVGKHAAMGKVPLHERTTPAGRFASVPGRNLQGEHVVWADYESAFAIHRLRPGASHKPRAQRLASPTPDDNRVSLGCVIVPVAFYTQVVAPHIGRGRAVVYVLPESGSLRGLFNSH